MVANDPFKNRWQEQSGMPSAGFTLNTWRLEGSSILLVCKCTVRNSQVTREKAQENYTARLLFVDKMQFQIRENP